MPEETTKASTTLIGKKPAGRWQKAVRQMFKYLFCVDLCLDDLMDQFRFTHARDEQAAEQHQPCQHP